MNLNILNAENIIKCSLATFLFLCLADMSYGYYQLVRFIAIICFSLLAYNANKRAKKIEVIIYVSLVLLFQPFIKIALGRPLWNIIDVIVGIGLIISLIFNLKNRKQ